MNEENDFIEFNSNKNRIQFDLNFSFENSDYHLNRFGYVGKFGNSMAVFIKHPFKKGVCIFHTIPKNESLENSFFINVSGKDKEYLSEKYEISLCKHRSEFLYDTAKFIEQAKQSSKYKYFINHNDIKIFNTYDYKDIEECFKKWCDNSIQRGNVPNKTFEDIMYALENKDKYKTKSVFVNIDNALVGFAIGCLHSEKFLSYISLFNYTSSRTRGLTEFLRVKRAELFDTKFFIDAVEYSSTSLLKNKLELASPEKIIEKYFIKTGERK